MGYHPNCVPEPRRLDAEAMQQRHMQVRATAAPSVPPIGGSWQNHDTKCHGRCRPDAKHQPIRISALISSLSSPAIHGVIPTLLGRRWHVSGSGLRFDDDERRCVAATPRQGTVQQRPWQRFLQRDGGGRQNWVLARAKCGERAPYGSENWFIVRGATEAEDKGRSLGERPKDASIPGTTTSWVEKHQVIAQNRASKQSTAPNLRTGSSADFNRVHEHTGRSGGQQVTAVSSLALWTSRALSANPRPTALESRKLLVQSLIPLVRPRAALIPTSSVQIDAMADGHPVRDIKNHLLFEIATEVAHRVGGIYSVLKSKAPVTTAEYGDRYTLIGPLNHQSAAVEVEEMEPTNKELAATMQTMKDRGIGMLYGRWLIEGAPRVLLIDTKTAYNYVNEWKSDLWSVASIPSPPDDEETNEAVVFGYLVAWFLGEFVCHEKEKAVIAHFHEWLAGVALPLTKKRRIDVTTIFTTHATLLGRYLCAGSVDFYNNLQYFDVDAEAGKRGIYHRYCIERAAAHSCDVFTTVSHITAFESEHLLKRKPDGVLPNGLNVTKFSAVHEFQNLHQQAKEKIHDFVRGHFYGHYDFEPENTLYFFTAGRYEFRNKGVDMFIESLARLNHRLKAANSKMTVVAFIIMPAQTTSLTVEALKGQAVIKSLKDTTNIIEQAIGRRIFERSLKWHEGDPMPDEKELISGQDRVLLRRRLFAMKRHGLPPIVTHNMLNDSEDPVLNQIRRVQLFNHPSDRVKVVFHPEFLNSANPVLPLDYDDFVRGCHMGVFPSYYEPWGYTPAECTVMGVPSITTNLSGFGCYMEELIENSSDYGIYIVDRRMKGVEDSVNQLCSFMFDYCGKSRRQRINQRNRTERLSDLLDWKRMGMEYIKARQLALRRAYPNSFHGDEEEEELEDFIRGPEQKISRPFSVPGSPRDRTGMMTPGDFASLQEGREGLSTEDYVAWKLPEEEDPEEYPFSLTLRTKQPGPVSPETQATLNGN
ncbi:hypothetical protein TgHK011_008801 [Trichoderma gracile]|nr:hypothetical protein TgHK011_008801 [Trichoderma gracile]